VSALPSFKVGLENRDNELLSAKVFDGWPKVAFGKRSWGDFGEHTFEPVKVLILLDVEEVCHQLKNFPLKLGLLRKIKKSFLIEPVARKYSTHLILGVWDIQKFKLLENLNCDERV
jgi:hypothetical protein